MTNMVEIRTSIEITIPMTKSLTEIGVTRKTRDHFMEERGEVRRMTAFMISANSSRNSSSNRLLSQENENGSCVESKHNR